MRVGISRVIVLDTLEQKCAATGGYVDDGVADNTNTSTALAEKNIVKLPTEIGVVRLGIDPPNTYCASYSGVAPWQNELPVLVNTENPFSGDSGLLRHRAAVTLAHELAHFFGIMVTPNHPHHLNAHVANEIPDIMVWNGIPIEAVRPDGMFFKFLTACTPVYDEYLCAGVKATASSSIATPLICLGDSECLIDTDADGSPDECPEPSSICIADVFPLDSKESLDTDDDGIGNNTDTDDDNDGVFDDDDAFPLDPLESSDTDMDGAGDNNDAFPNNSLYTMDSDSDGMPDSWEVKYGLNPNDPNDANSDRNNDSITALDEFLSGGVPSGVLDLDGDGQYDALTDGLILLRGMFGLDGNTLVTGAIASGAFYTEPVDIESRIATLGDLADIDGNGDRTGDFEQEGQRDRSPVPGIAQVIGEAAGIPVLAKVTFHGEEDVTSLGSPMEIVEVGVEGMICRVLAGIGLVSFLVKSDMKLQNGVGPAGKVTQIETTDTARTGSIHMGEPVVAAQPGAGGGIVAAAKEARFGEKVSEA